MSLYPMSEFIRLSAALNYQLPCVHDCSNNILLLIIGNRRVPKTQRDILTRVIHYLARAYGEERRRLGPLAVLHPVRATALLARSQPETNFLDLLTCLLHDKFEDITAGAVVQAGHDQKYFQELERQFEEMLGHVEPTDRWYLMERLEALTRHPDETYYTYIGKLMERAASTPELVRVKLADRLDNTLDLHLDVLDPLEEVDFYDMVFQVLFVHGFTVAAPAMEHPSTSVINGAQRLYQLFKNAVLLSLIRRHKVTLSDTPTRTLFDGLAAAGMEEAQRIIIHIFQYHYRDVEDQRELLMDTMGYCREEGIARITPATRGHRLDGLFKDYFDFVGTDERRRKQTQLYADKPLMVEAALAFIVIFKSFLIDKDYFIEGVSAAGISDSQ
ncbi:HD domain-containing protein [bacterium]|nr:HD domain-containing protein [candidate division CSSED10-310 bacterium]